MVPRRAPYHLHFNRNGVYDLYEKLTDGAVDERLFYHSDEGKGPTSWSLDGKFLVYYSLGLGQPTHVRLLTIAGPADRQSAPVVDPKFTSITAGSRRTAAGFCTPQMNRARTRFPSGHSMQRPMQSASQSS